MRSATRDPGLLRGLPYRRARDLLASLLVGAPQCGLLVAVALLLRGRVAAWEWALLGSSYGATMFGMTLGYHRLSAHRSFETGAALKTALLALGAMCGVGPPLMWASSHRRHHAQSETPGDPHSPHVPHRSRIRGFLHAHVLWIFDDEMANPLIYAKDLLHDHAVTRVGRLYLPLTLLGLVIPGLVGWVVTRGAVDGLLRGLLWGGLVRMALSQHAVWSLGSIAHLFGAKPFPTRDESRNNLGLALLSLGEGWHNNHHAFPSAAVHGFAWHEPDVTGLCVKALAVCGLIWNVRKAPDRDERAHRKKGERS
jgi:stearoyl-CoA desaturase (delta-9 desaturase)